ncbi:hypothetical protein OSB04_002889 [Centaurea solstitialis]|uniref:Uncharacterized protein n=1 Tax=Centaurea solstitialis TaxID=347529 RepID=A0AA38TTR8_9ASTR|nr:hypothetical protein OSB04_002889 [Centaurea solstitialis]
MVRFVEIYGQGVKSTTKILDKIKERWKTTGYLCYPTVNRISKIGVTLAFWSIIHMALCFETVDAYDCVKDANTLFEHIIVVQVVTDNAKAIIKDEEDPLIVEDVHSDDECMVHPNNEEDDDSISVEKSMQLRMKVKVRHP